MNPYLPASLTAALLVATSLLPCQSPAQFRGAAKRTIPLHFDAGAATGLHGADIDGDGDIDLWLTSRPASVTPSGQDRVYRNDGRGVFEDVTMAAIGVESDATTGGVFADFDADGDPDFLQLQGGQDRLWNNDGAGHFTDVTATHMPLESEFGVAIAAGDLDGDGDLDALVVNAASTRFYRNDGTGGFVIDPAALPTLAVGQVTLADLDANGTLDVLLVDPNQNPAVRCFEFAGAAFVDRTTQRLANPIQQAWQVAAFDADGDGDLDLVAASRGFVSNQFYRNGGTGVLQADTDPGFAATSHQRVTAADIDGDGDVDLVLHPLLGSLGPPEIARNDGTGVFTLDAPSVGPSWITDMLTDAYAVLDLDGDASVDLVVAGIAHRRTRTSAAGAWAKMVEHWYRNDGTGSFVRSDEHSLPTGMVYAACGDYDGDGDVDLLQFGDGGRLLRNDGKRRFTDVTAAALPPLGLFDQARLVDLTGDGLADLLTTSGDPWTSQTVRLLVGNGAAFVDETTTRLPVIGARAFSCDLGDVDGDGDLDVLVADMNTSNLLLTNDGTGVFTKTALGGSAATSGALRSVQLVDLDADGDLDYASLVHNRVELFENDGTGAFTLRATITSGTSSLRRTLEIGDFDGDGLPDVFLSFYSTDSAFHYGQAPWSWAPAQSIGGGAGLRASDSRTFDCDGDGDPDIVVNSQIGITLLLNEGGGSMSDRSDLVEDGVGSLGGLTDGDLDGDGDLDLVLSGEYQDRIYWNHQVHLDLPDPAQPGERYRIEVSHQPGALVTPAMAAIAFAETEANTWWPGVGVIGLDLTQATLLGLYPVPSPAGLLQVDLQVTNLPALHGLQFFAQALILDPALPSGGLQLTNSEVDVVR